MFARRLVSLAILLGLAASGVTPASAGADVCPEPNGDLASACFLGPGGPASGFIDSPDDVDGYRIDLPVDSMVVATLRGLPADYGLRLLRSDASVQTEAVQPGRGDKSVRADGLPAGTYYLAVFSISGEANPDQPYLISVAYSASLVLVSPAVSTAPDGALQGGYGYVPGPARSYALQLSDLESRFREVAHEESEDGRLYFSAMLARDAAVAADGALLLSSTIYSVLIMQVVIAPYGSNDDLTAAYDEHLDFRRNKEGAIVEPAIGWPETEKVHSYAWPGRTSNNGVPTMYRGIALKHRNAYAYVEIGGLEQLADWGSVASLARIVESRIIAAVQ